MTLYYPLLEQPLEFGENRVNVLIIEEPGELRRAVGELLEQTAGRTGEFVLGIDFAPAELSRQAVLVTDPFRLELDSRKMAGKILQSAVRAFEDRGEELREILGRINALAAEVGTCLDFEAAFTELEDPADLVRLLDFRVDREGLSLPEQLLEFMRLQRQFFDKRLFIFYGLKGCLTREELSGLYRNVFYEKLDLLLLEPFQRGAPMEGETVTIVDGDLCIIR